jgi:ABC-2 type transport system ATP-binding protein
MITVEHLTKRYGDFTAVNDLSFEIDEGHVYGFLGPNGAGKSTTMNIMTGCLSATEGHVQIDGHDIFEEPNQAKKLIGYLPEQPPLYMNETPAEYLRFVGEAKGLRGTELAEQIVEVMEQTKISHMRNRRISALSKGYKQRVGIAQALLGNPKVIILDEPTVGLDPIQIIEIRDLIRQLGQKHTVILSSHILSEVQTICDKILIIAHGKLIAFDDPEKLENSLKSPNEITFTAEAAAEEVQEILSEISHITDVETKEKEEGMTQVHLKTDHDNVYDISRQLFFAFAAKEKALLEMNLKKANLEDIFIELTEQVDAEGGAVPSEKADENEIEIEIESEESPESPESEASEESEVDVK